MNIIKSVYELYAYNLCKVEEIQSMVVLRLMVLEQNSFFPPFM